MELMMGGDTETEKVNFHLFHIFYYFIELGNFNPVILLFII